MTTPPQDPFASPPPGEGAPGYGPPPSQAPTYGTPPPGAPGYGPPPYQSQPYQQQPAWGPPAYGYPVQQTETKAIVALVLAIASFVVFPLVPAIVALVLASTAQRDIDASGGRLGGGGLVTAAKIVAWINLGLCVAVVVFAILALALLAGSSPS